MTHYLLGIKRGPTQSVKDYYDMSEVTLILQNPQTWNGRGHFFAAAAEAMRRIVIEEARSRSRLKRGGNFNRVDFESVELPSPIHNVDIDELLTLNEALDELERNHPTAAELVKLRYFGGLSLNEAHQSMGIGKRQADTLYKFARAWLLQNMGGEKPDDEAVG